MRIGFRTDASLHIGAGHVMRCLALADALRQCGAECLFFCRPHIGHLIDLIEQRGHAAIVLPAIEAAHENSADAFAYEAWLGVGWATDAMETCFALGQLRLDWIVVDHYALGRDWERVLRPYCKRIMVIDDLANRAHDCNLLLDQNLGRSKVDYVDLVPEGATILTGPEFALLRPEFARLRPESLARRMKPTFKKLLISMGGVDKVNLTERVLSVLESCELPKDLQITVVMGPKAPWLGRVIAKAAVMRRHVDVLVNVSDMASLMAQSDLAIGAAGSTSWERCCLGLPSIQMVVADNQQVIADALARSGAARTADVSNLTLVLGAVGLDASLQNLTAMSRAAAKLTAGCGAAEVVAYLVSFAHENHDTLH